MSSLFDDNNDDIIGGEEASEYDSPILLFFDDDDDDDELIPSAPDIAVSDGDTDADDGQSDESDPADSGEPVKLSFGHVNTTKKEKEFYYMPFLDIPDSDADEDNGYSGAGQSDDDSEAVTLTFSKVKAEKKEKEFVFLPFLYDTGASDDSGDAKSAFRTSKGTIIDEGLTLIPLEADEDPEADVADQKAEAEASAQEADDTGIYLVGTSGGTAVPPTAPHQGSQPPPNKKKKSSKKRPPSNVNMGVTRSDFDRLSPEQKFHLAMRNIDPALRASVKNDPIQRAALEQAVRIAIVQQAAHEAVERSSGKPVFGTTGFSASDIRRAEGQNRPPKSRKRPPAERPHREPVSPPMAVPGSFDSMPSEFQVSEPLAQPDFASMFSPVSLHPEPAPAPAPTPASAPVPDPIPAQKEPESDSAKGEIKPTFINSPAAARASAKSGDTAALTPSPIASRAAAYQATPRYGRLQREDENTTRSGCMIWLIVLFVVFFIGIIAVAVVPSLSKEMSYRSANAALEGGQYLDAAHQFDELDDYKDSETQMYESYYRYAQELIDGGNYQSALDRLLTIEANYPPASESIAVCRYAIGNEYLQNGEFANAYNQLYLIPKYLNAGDLAMQANYKCAEELEAAGDYENARIRFAMYPDYIDSRARWQKAQYTQAMQHYKNDEYDTAYNLLREITDYKDAAFQAAMAQYNAIRASFVVPYSQKQMYDCIIEFDKYKHMPEVQEALTDEAYIGPKMIGKWSDGVNSIEYTFTESGTLLTINLSDYIGGTIKAESVSFNGATVFSFVGESAQNYFRVNDFDSNFTAYPQTMTVYSFLTNQIYTLTRVA